MSAQQASAKPYDSGRPAIRARAFDVFGTVLSSAACTAHQMLKQLGLKTILPNAGASLSGRY